jgi:hypothetical protein
VKMDGKNACRLTDKMFHNSENAANLTGEIQGVATDAFADRIGDRDAADKLCDAACDALKRKAAGAPGKLQDLMNERLSSSSFPTHGGQFTTYLPKFANILSEVPALTPLTFGSAMLPLVSMTGRVLSGGTSVLAPMAPGAAAFGGVAAAAKTLGGRLVIWDAVILKNPAAGVTSSNVSRYVEVKFGPDKLTRNQRIAKLSMNDSDWAKRVEMRPEQDCRCN